MTAKLKPAKPCLHCGKLRRQCPRGLCYRCYGTPSIRPNYPVESKYAPWANEGWMAKGLTASERENGPAYYVVGTRMDGSRLILADVHTVENATKLRDRFAAQLVGYTSIIVEHIKGKL